MSFKVSIFVLSLQLAVVAHAGDRKPMFCHYTKSAREKQVKCADVTNLAYVQSRCNSSGGVVPKACFYQGGTWKWGTYKADCAAPGNVAKGSFVMSKICDRGIDVSDAPTPSDIIGPSKDYCKGMTPEAGKKITYNSVDCADGIEATVDPDTQTVTYCFTKSSKASSGALPCVTNDSSTSGYCEKSKEIAEIKGLPASVKSSYNGTWWVRYGGPNMTHPQVCIGGIQIVPK